MSQGQHSNPLPPKQAIELAKQLLLRVMPVGRSVIVSPFYDAKSTPLQVEEFAVWEQIADLQPSVDRFVLQSQALELNRSKFPCATRPHGHPIPVDPSSLGQPASGISQSRYQTDISSLKIEYFDPREAAGFFDQGLSDFLSSRFGPARPSSAAGGAGSGSGGGAAGGGGGGHPYSFVGGSPGLAFKVTTISPGLTVHFTHQYYLNPNYVFGGPTTPVLGHMQPGHWHFGTSRGVGTVTWDYLSVYDVPAVFQAHLPV